MIKVPYLDVARDPHNLYVNKTPALDAPGRPWMHLDVNKAPELAMNQTL